MTPIGPVTPRRTGIVQEPTRSTPGDDRLAPIIAAIDEAPWSAGVARLCPRVVATDHLALAHSPTLIDQVCRAAHGTNDHHDPASRFEARHTRAALAAVGSVIAAVDAVIDSGNHDFDAVFALVSSPGHQATADRALGHCLLNNVAIAARYAQRAYDLSRVMILDWDAHHGSGTEAIFAADPSVLTLSLHQWPLYPGSGWFTDVGQGPGLGFAVNVPLPPGSGDAAYRAAFARIVEPIADQFAPALLLIAAGFDCHAAHPLSDLMVTFDGLRSMTRSARRIADRHCGGRIVLALESGYNPATPPWLAAGILATLGDLPFAYHDPCTPRRSAMPPSQQRRLDEVTQALASHWRL